MNASDYFDVGMKFHGHKCPAMPLGLRAAAAAMNALNVDRSQDKELMLLAETGDDHAAGCFVDGLMTVTGCTYGKSNVKKTYHGKMAFTLIDTRRNKAVRVQLKPDFFGKMLNSPFVQQRKQGVPPQDVPASITDPLVDAVMARAESEFLEIGPVFDYAFTRTKGTFDTDLCESCGERVFVNKLHEVDGKKLCIPCHENLKAVAE
ncbi:MAG: FmdE family protein [Ancalomicrobiaceae bacterium]|nr:FmdE family protein [Ancalomicrobiaceae bacterium]